MDHPISSPARAAGPTARAEGRLQLLDALRGLAALGILWRNIFVFGLPTVAFTLPDEWGLSTAANVFSWLFVVIFVDGTMRGLFSMLFGATAVIIMASHERNPGGVFAADLYFRRLMWLVAFGLVHGYLLLWPYDVLYVYGLLGMFLFVFRNMSGARCWPSHWCCSRFHRSRTAPDGAWSRPPSMLSAPRRQPCRRARKTSRQGPPPPTCGLMMPKPAGMRELPGSGCFRAGGIFRY